MCCLLSVAIFRECRKIANKLCKNPNPNPVPQILG